MIEGILINKDGKKYRIYKSPNITKEHKDFEILVSEEGNCQIHNYIVWEEIWEEIKE